MRQVTLRKNCFKYRGFVFDRLQHLVGNIIANEKIGHDSRVEYEWRQDEVHNQK